MSGHCDSPQPPGKEWLGYVVAAVCLVWVFHDVQWGELVSRMRSMTWWLLAPAVAADIGSYVIQGVRWSLLLRPLGRLSVLRSTQAIYAGLFTNEVLPLRVGEVLRGYLASQWIPLPMTQVLSSVLVERLIDGVWMVLAFGILVLMVPLPGYLVHAEEVLAVMIFAAAALLVYVIARPGRRVSSASPGPSGRLSRWVGPVAAALRSIGGSPSLYGAAAASGLVLALQAVSFWLVMQAYGISLPIWHGAAVFLIVHLGTMAPGAPSNIGTYQFFTVLGLLLFGVDKTVASGFSIAVFLILTMPLWAIGLFAFGSSGLNLAGVRDKAGDLKELWRRSRATAARGEFAPEPPDSGKISNGG